MTTKYVWLGLGLSMLLGSQEIFACHDFFAKDATTGNLSGHKPKYSYNITTVPTEATTASFSTTSKCDWYAQFIHKDYELIAEEAAQGQGPRLNILSEMMGCPASAQSHFVGLLKNRYEGLFITTEQPLQLVRTLRVMIESHPQLQKVCHVS